MIYSFKVETSYEVSSVLGAVTFFEESLDDFAEEIA